MTRKQLKERVDEVCPSWESWYPSVFHAAEDLGIIRAQVCDPSDLLLSTRHADVQKEAQQMFAQIWNLDDV